MRYFSLEIMQAKRPRSTERTKTTINQDCVTQKKIFQKERQNKDFSDIPKLKQYTTSIQHYTEGSSQCNKTRTNNKGIYIGKE